MEKSEIFEERWARILACTNTASDSALARVLEILPQSVSAARKRGQIPPGWIEKISQKFGITTDWLFFGREPQFVLPGKHCLKSVEPDERQTFSASMETTISKLEKELEIDRKERREVSEENRLLHKENASLLRENGELKVTVAQLVERLKAVERGGKQPAATSKDQSA